MNECTSQVEVSIHIREYKESDILPVLSLYYDTVHEINIRHYSLEQVNAWVPKKFDRIARWKKRLRANATIVATCEDEIVGFGNLEHGLTTIGMLYVHKRYQGKGVAKRLLNELENMLRARNIREAMSEVSITARPFFERQGYRWIRDNHKLLNGVPFMNYIMQKNLDG